jgi:hypothetical protein
LSWDIDAVNNLCRIATSDNEIIKNPMMKSMKKQIDLMVLSYKLFWDELHAKDNNGNRGGNRGIFTVANMHKILCEHENVEIQQQKHLAEYDLDMETDILSIVLGKFDDTDHFEEYVEKRNKNGNLTIPFWNKKKN